MDNRYSAEDILNKIPKPPNYTTFLELKTRLGFGGRKLSKHLTKLEQSGQIVRKGKHGTNNGAKLNFEMIQKTSESTD